MATDELVTYLNDHLMGARAALSLIDRLISDSESATDRGFFQTLKGEIEEDVTVVEELIERAGGRQSIVRQAGGWIGEKFATLKLRFDDPAGGRLNHFEALEMLTLGILGKRALWRALRGVSADLPWIATFDVERLEARAQDQHDRVEARRVGVARRIFTTSKDETSAAER